MHDVSTPFPTPSFFLLAPPAATQFRCSEGETNHTLHATRQHILHTERSNQNMRASSRNIAWSGLWVSRLRLLLLMLLLLVGVEADTGSCSCPTRGFIELEEATTGASPEEALEFVTEINSFCATPDRDSCVAPCLCQCRNGGAIGRAAAGGGTHIICRRNDGVCVDPGANVRAHFEHLYYSRVEMHATI